MEVFRQVANTLKIDDVLTEREMQIINHYEIPKEQKQNVSDVVANVMKETKKLEERWGTCSFDCLCAYITLLKKRASEEGLNAIVCGHWAELAELILDSRTSEIYPLADDGEGLIND